ncbi:hypothetical protein NM688_g536 [Phlebia brevispora]|uniref:Uncharacterized protein n=1 Tax=Phlebia brevispora TaxID=194682 RepID=A0ACC1TDV3_9APHY|nr:hypothetical protein NM688_g536 [Phlebia brevispora]
MVVCMIVTQAPNSSTATGTFVLRCRHRHQRRTRPSHTTSSTCEQGTGRHIHVSQFSTQCPPAGALTRFTGSMDILDFGSLAHIRILLLPVGNIKRAAFDHWVKEIRSFENIRLGDIPADTREEKARFMPGPLATGYIHLSYPLRPLPTTHLPLSLFRPADFPLGVVGIATCSQSDSLSSILAQFNASMSEMFPPGAIFPLANNCFVFEESDGSTTLNLGNLPGLVVIPGMMGNKKLYVGTLLADLCSNILAEFATVVQSLETPLGNEYLNATLFPILPPPSEMPKPLDVDGNPRTSLPPLPIQHSQPELPTASSILRSMTPSTLSVKRNSSIGPGLSTSPYRHASLPNHAVKKRQTAIGAVSSHGRLFKVLGDLFLLAGRTTDASIWYGEAVALLKNTQDLVWHASAMEGLATIPVLDAWSSMQANGADDEKEPWADVAEKIAQAASMYQRASPSSDQERNYPFVSWFYTRAVLKHTALLFAIWTAKGWGPLAFTIMLQSGLPALSATLQEENRGSNVKKRISYNTLERHAIITGITRASISNTLAQAHGPWLLHLGASERISILESMGAMYSILGYKRKEAYVLREVLGCVMDLVACAREEGGGAKITGAGLGIHGVDVGVGTNQSSVGIRTNDSSQGNESVLRVVKYVCRVHGIDLEAVKLVTDATRRVSGSPTDEDEDEFTALAEPYGWPELQIGIVREAIAVAESLPDYPSVAQFCLSALKTLYRVMSQSDQLHLYTTASRALATAKRRGDNRCVDYWSGRPVVSVEVMPLPLVRLPIEKPTSLLSQEHTSFSPILTGMTDPFLYNPRRLSAGQQNSTLLVQNEPFEMVVTLRNPFIFDLDLSSLMLSTSGAAIEAKPIAVTIPANSYHPVTMSGTALEAGILTIRGCIVQAPGGAPREFLLPASTEEEETKRSRRWSAIECETGRFKRSGLDSRPWERQAKRISSTAPTAHTTPLRFLECKVVPQQPLLRIRRTSLTHGALMLYDGERSSIRVTLENISALPIDFIHLTFDDSTIAPAQHALAEGHLSVFETYETEYDLIHRPIFTWDSQRNVQEVQPGEKVVVTVECYGKVGCTSGTVHVSYSHFHRPKATLETPANIFHTRQISYPILVTVYHMLECLGMDILPYSPDTISSLSDAETDSTESSARKLLLEVEQASDWCMFSVEVRNTYGLPFEVQFERAQSDATTESESLTTFVPPGSTSRVIIPIRKIHLTEEEISRPIPTLSDRQFVVAKSNLSNEEEKTQRELFWYREALFERSGGSRYGDLSLRRQRLTQRMLDALRVEPVRVEMSLCLYADAERRADSLSCEGGVYYPPLNEFVCLRVKLTNLSPSQHTLTVNFTMDPAQYILYEGVLMDVPVGRVDIDQSQEIELPVTFVSCGRFEIFGDVYVNGPEDKRRIARGQLRASVEE